jgi:hypothetical protein
MAREEEAGEVLLREVVADFEFILSRSCLTSDGFFWRKSNDKTAV